MLIDFPTLGILSTLPAELRNRIYKSCLNFNEHREGHLAFCHHSISYPQRREPNRTSLLTVSRRIHYEAIICLYQVNEWVFWVEKETEDPKNKSIMGRLGYSIHFAHKRLFDELKDDAWFDKIPTNMIPYLQHVTLNVGSLDGIREYDIVPTRRQTTVGPERATFTPLLTKVKEVCEILRRCNNLRSFNWGIRSLERTPKSIEVAMDPIISLRGIKNVNVLVSSVHDDCWVDWRMNRFYVQYLKLIMSLPEDSVTPAYAGDAKELELVVDKIFTKVGARWLGDGTFESGNSGSEDEEDEDNEDEEDNDEDGWFGANPFDLVEHLFPGVPFPLPGLWSSEYATSSEQESDDDGYDSEGDNDDDEESMPYLVPCDHC
jgi:hypothetical protein